LLVARVRRVRVAPRALPAGRLAARPSQFGGAAPAGLRCSSLAYDEYASLLAPCPRGASPLALGTGGSAAFACARPSARATRLAGGRRIMGHDCGAAWSEDSAAKGMQSSSERFRKVLKTRVFVGNMTCFSGDRLGSASRASLQ
jgi:hypothetical protein